MFVSELIKMLEKMPQDYEVVGAGDCGDYPGDVTVYKAAVDKDTCEWCDNGSEVVVLCASV